MQQNVQSFKAFVPGNHLILGAAGSGKTQLTWALLQSSEFCGKGTVNIVLTDSAKRIWLNPSANPIIPVNPYAPDVSWIAEPTKPGIYYAACEYLPRVTTFLECLANYARHDEQEMEYPVRVFIDFPKKYWRDEHFCDQVNRLVYISESLAEEGDQPLEIWSVLTSPQDVNLKQYSLFKNSHLILMNPVSKSLLDDVRESLGKELNLVNSGKTSTDGSFYYVTQTGEEISLVSSL